MNKLFLLIVIVFIAVSCKHKKEIKETAEPVKLNEDSLFVVNYADSKRNIKRKSLKVYCYCYGQRPNYGHCKVQFGMSPEQVIKYNQVVFFTSNSKIIDSILYTMVYNSKITGVKKHGMDTRLVIKIDNADSTYSTINIGDYESEYITYNDTVSISLEFNPVLFLNRITGVKNIECY